MKKLLIVLVAFAASLFAHAQTDTVSLQEVVVTGTRNATDVRHLPMTVTVVNRQQLEERRETSVLPAVSELVPGLFVTSRSMFGYGVSTGAAGGINMRGISGGAGQLMVLIDGHPQYNGVYGHPISDSYQTLLAERVEVLHGPASVLYGSNAMGGVVNIVTRHNTVQHDFTTTNFNLSAGSYGTVEAEASNQTRQGAFTSTVAAQYSRTDNHRPRMGFEQYGGYAKLGYDLTAHWNAYIDADITHFNASYPGSEQAPLYEANQWITRGVVSAAVENHYEHTSGAVSIYSNFGRHKIDDGTANPDAPTARYFRSKDLLSGLSWYQSASLFRGNRLTVGFDYQYIYGKAYYTSKETGEELDTPNKQSGRSYRNEVAGYVDFRQDIASWLTVDAGVRLDHYSLTGNEWIPQGGIVVRPITTGELKAMVSKGFRNPTMREMYLYPPSNEELEPERLMNYELSWKHRLAQNKLVYGINLYYIKGDNMIQTVERKNVNTGKVENKGIELTADYKLDSHWAFTTNHSWLQMEYKIIAAPIYKGYLGGRYAVGKWTANVGLQYVSGLYTEVGEEEQKENFWLLNANVNYALCKNINVWVRGENLLAQQYEINAGYPMPKATFMGGISVRL